MYKKDRPAEIVARAALWPTLPWLSRGDVISIDEKDVCCLRRTEDATVDFCSVDCVVFLSGSILIRANNGLDSSVLCRY